MNSDKFGEFIRNKRKEKGLTQQQLGDIVGVSMKAVSKWECGLSPLSYMPCLAHEKNTSL